MQSPRAEHSHPGADRGPAVTGPTARTPLLIQEAPGKHCSEYLMHGLSAFQVLILSPSTLFY